MRISADRCGCRSPPREQTEVAAANASDQQPVVFVHGLWMLAGSWDAWRELFEERGYSTIAVDWPDDPPNREEALSRPEVFAGKTVGQVADHVADVIRALQTRKPIVVGHSFGGLMAQIVAGRGWPPARSPSTRRRSVACCRCRSRRSRRRSRCSATRSTGRRP